MTPLTMNDGHSIPGLGFGTYPLRGEKGAAAIRTAIDAGYRLIDTAFNYDNEAAVGRAIADSDVLREDFFVTSKLPGRYHAYDAARDAIHESAWRLGLDYIDLYLIHWPNPSEGRFAEAWQALVDAREEGTVRSVGVANFTLDHLAVVEEATGVRPVINQIELHPYFPQEEMLAAHTELGIVTEAWSPLGERSAVRDDPVIGEIARAHGVSPAQAVLRWHLQRGVLPIPKSADPVRQADNLDVFAFELTDDEVEAITALGRPDGRILGEDPDLHQEM